MWTWTYEAHEFTHDDNNNNNQVIALFSLSLTRKRRTKKKKLILRGCFFFAYERDVSFWRFLARRSLSYTDTSLVCAEFNLRRYLHQRIVVERWSFCLDLVVRTL